MIGNREQSYRTLYRYVVLLLSVTLGVFFLGACGSRKTPPSSSVASLIQDSLKGLNSAFDTESKALSEAPSDSLIRGAIRNRISPSDSTRLSTSDSVALSEKDTLPLFAQPLDSASLWEAPMKLGAVVELLAQDSMVMLGKKQIFFFGPSSINYESMHLAANFMRMDADSSQIYAQYTLDSLGYAAHFPKFSDGTQEFESKTMKYNFSTRQGFISGVTSRQGEGYLTSDKAKRMENNVLFIEDGRYTTCSLHDHPHFYINLTKAKVIPDDKIITGPAYLVVGGVPIYLLGLPFGFFPLNEKRTTGIVMPSYGIDQNKGLYLRNGGVYINFNDYVDLTLNGEVYTNGSWGVHALSSYRKRYKYNGSFDAGFITTVQGDREIPSTYFKSRDFTIRWSHSQDSKADLFRTFSASVNFSTSSYNHNSTSQMFNPAERAENNKGSSVSYTRRFAGMPLSITAAFNLDQRSKDSTLSVSFPNLSISLGTIYPFKQKKRVGKEQWYEKISLSYSGSLRNSITTKEHLILQSNLLRDWKNGMQHNIPIQATFDLFDYIKITPSFHYNAIWYTSRVEREWDSNSGDFTKQDTIYGFYHTNTFSASLSASTVLYGFFKPWSIFGDKIQMIRHRFTPSISLNYMPNFADPKWGYYRKLQNVNSTGELYEREYSPYEWSVFGAPSRGKTGSVQFNFDNNIEMKLKNASDSTAQESFRKISLIDQLGISFAYNMMADSMKWSPISANISIRLSSSFALRLNGTFDTYLYDYTLDADGRPRPFQADKLRVSHGKGFGRLVGTGTSFNYTFNNETFDKIAKFFGGGQDSKEDKKSGTESSGAPDPMNRSLGDLGTDNSSSDSENETEPSYSWDEFGYLKQKFPWSLSLNYSMNLGYDYNKFDIVKKEYEYRLTHNLSLRGQFSPTANWNFTFDSNYNFDLKKLTSMTIAVRRNMHCWHLSASIIPIGPYKSYTVTVGATAQLLQDLKWQKNSLPSYTTGIWY